jgi:hypothetical protein
MNWFAARWRERCRTIPRRLRSIVKRATANEMLFDVKVVTVNQFPHPD